MDFAVMSLKLTDEISGHYSLKNQFERSAASIGANIREANKEGLASVLAKRCNDFVLLEKACKNHVK